VEREGAGEEVVESSLQVRQVGVETVKVGAVPSGLGARAAEGMAMVAVVVHRGAVLAAHAVAAMEEAERVVVELVEDTAAVVVAGMVEATGEVKAGATEAVKEAVATVARARGRHQVDTAEAKAA
jgi:hypothetical protein